MIMGLGHLKRVYQLLVNELIPLRAAFRRFFCNFCNSEIIVTSTGNSA